MHGEAGARGTLYVVGTPIGNLEDLSPRARAALAGSRVVACEDTRQTRTLMARHGLATPLVSYHKFNEQRRAGDLLDRLRRGESVALVTDGGTPGISDPGAVLVRRAHQEGHRVVPIPGASAVTALLSASGFAPGPFTFIGFLPHRQGPRRRLLEALRHEPRALLFFESPRRLAAALRDALEILGDRPAFLGREMTKVHEEFRSGTLREILAAFAGREIRGEVAFLVAGGLDRKEAMRRVARERGVSRRDVYREVLEEEGASPAERPGRRGG